jgi:acyl-CoA synthetase (AMP-forming)/AMP-acid ligase II
MGSNEAFSQEQSVLHFPDSAEESPCGELCNIATRLREVAARLPRKRAVVCPCGRDSSGRVKYTQLTFAQLDRESDAIARGLSELGIADGVRTSLFVKPGLDFYAITFALFKTGAVPVLIDPGMGRERLLHCLVGVEPEALIGIAQAQLARLLFPKYFRSVKTFISVGRRWCWGGYSLAGLKKHADEKFDLAPTREEDLAAILFTTGSTGPAKGVAYEHGMFEAQCQLIGQTYGIGGEDIDLPTFPLFGLFSVALGMTAVIPDMDPTRPAHVEPEKIIEAVWNQGCTFSFGSPALWGKVTKHCVERNISLPGLRKILMAGAPVAPEVHERFAKILDKGAETHTPYGATEALPVADMTGAEVLAETGELTRKGKGVCVGRPVSGVTVEVIKISDEPIAEWSDSLKLPTGEIGELVAQGGHVTKKYFRNDAATALAKIPDGGCVRHRMGDLGYLDEKGRIWFCGRKSHRVETERGILYTVCCEAIFNCHENVFRSALVGIGDRSRQRPVIIIEPVSMPKNRSEELGFINELLQLARGNELTRHLPDILLHPSFPVDIRHNAKIFREKLAFWAAKKLEEAR